MPEQLRARYAHARATSCDKYHVRKYGAHGTSHRYELDARSTSSWARKTATSLLALPPGFRRERFAAIEDGVVPATPRWASRRLMA